MAKVVNKLSMRSRALYQLAHKAYERFGPINVPQRYPTDLNFEITTLCNSKCTFCTHEEVTRSGARPARHMDYELAIQIINKFREMTRGIPENELHLGPVGLGEPLLHPRFFDIIDYARKTFPKASISANTNCIALKGKVAERMVDSGIDSLRLSLGFNDRETYSEQCGVDAYDAVVENIANFLRMKGDRPPAAAIHIFDKEENRKEFGSFVRKWSPHLNKKDSIIVQQYLPLTEWAPRNDGQKRWPCYQMWSLIMVDIEGYVYPCCISIWIPRDKGLCLGRITDDTASLLRRLDEVRKRHIAGDFGVCAGCSILSDMVVTNRRAYAKAKKKGVVK